MLKRALQYATEINDFIMDYDNREYLKYYLSNYVKPEEFATGEWNCIQTVSVVNNKPIAYFRAELNRYPNYVSSLSIFNLIKKSNPVIVKDLLQFVDDLFMFYQFTKLCFTIRIGNPAEMQYDKVIERLGGRIVGTSYQDAILPDNTVCDVKMYELLKQDYWKR